MQKSHWNHHQGMILLGILCAVCDFTYIRIALEFTRLQENEFQEVLPWKTTQYYVYDISRYTICKQARHIRYAMKMPGILGLQYPPKHNSECFWCTVDFGSIASSTCWANKIRQSGLGVWGHFNLAMRSARKCLTYILQNKETTNVSTALSLK